MSPSDNSGIDTEENNLFANSENHNGDGDAGLVSSSNSDPNPNPPNFSDYSDTSLETTATALPAPTDTDASLTTTPTPSERTTLIPSPLSSEITTTANNTEHGNSSGLPTRTKLAIAVPISIVGTAILAALLFLLLRRRRRHQKRQSLKETISAPKLETTPRSMFAPLPTLAQHTRPIQIQHVPVSPVPAPVPVPASVAVAVPAQAQIPIPRRPVPVPGTDIDVPETVEAEMQTQTQVQGGSPAIAFRDLEWRTSEERRREHILTHSHTHGERPRSPFDDPLGNRGAEDDGVSIVSGISDRGDAMRARGLAEDDLSSVSSFGDDDDDNDPPTRGANR